MPAKFTYESAILTAITSEGMLSRAALANVCKTRYGLDNASKLKTTIAKAVEKKLIKLDGARYILGDKTRTAAGEEYILRLRDARDKRDEEEREKKARDKRMEKKYEKNLKEAGGLSLTAQADRDWMAGKHTTHRPCSDALVSF